MLIPLPNIRTMRAVYQTYNLKFKQPGGTSRGVLKEKETFLIKLKTGGDNDPEFFGECGLFRGLSADDRVDYEDKIAFACRLLESGTEDTYEQFREFPSIQFGMEQIKQAQKHFDQKKHDDFNPILFPSEFTNGEKGISINGLIWMGSEDFMRQQIKDKISQGFRCIKLKIGVDWEMEHQILQSIRKKFPEQDLELRVDANGGFSFEEVQKVLDQLAELKIHSIEQPIRAGQATKMADLCAATPVPIALDEELIGVFYPEEKKKLLQNIRPQFIILKPSLIGGWKGSQEWIDLANENGAGWWVTSALESNIGLNAIAQWTFTLQNPLAQGLGTGGLFENNFYSRLKVKKDQLFFV